MNIKTCRKKREMTQHELAEKLGVSRSYISQIETDRRGISVRTAKKIARILEVPLNELVGE
jgi:transcriptional regulator with XRE-family HTH domain